MYTFKIKLWDIYNNPNRSYSFPSKLPRHTGGHIPKYNQSKRQLGWFKCKSEKEAIKSFIRALRTNIIEYKNPIKSQNNFNHMNRGKSYFSAYQTKQKENCKEDLEFLENLMRETEFRYLETFPEAFI